MIIVTSENVAGTTSGQKSSATLKTCFLIVTLGIIMLNLSGIFSDSVLIANTSWPDYEISEKPRVSGSLSMVPLSILINGLRIDYDYSISPNHWLQFGPVLFLSDQGERLMIGTPFNRHTGGGLHAYHRYYPGSGFGNESAYVGWGGMWHYSHFLYDETIAGRPVERYSAIHKFGGDVLIGMNFLASERFLLDFYTGLGIRFSTIRSDADAPQKFNESIASPGFAGITVLVGVRLGFTLFSSRP